MDFSDPYFEASQSLLVPTDSDIESVDDITSDTVVGAEDTTTGETYANEETDGEVRVVRGINEAFTALDNGQVDAVINDLPSSASAVEDSDGDLEIIEEFPTEELYGIVIPEDSDPLVEAVNEALATVKEDGTLDEIYQEWFGTTRRTQFWKRRTSRPDRALEESRSAWKGARTWRPLPV